jgi:hypothetical protein
MTTFKRTDLIPHIDLNVKVYRYQPPRGHPLWNPEGTILDVGESYLILEYPHPECGHEFIPFSDIQKIEYKITEVKELKPKPESGLGS